MSLLAAKAQLQADLVASFNNENTPDQTAAAIAQAMYNFAVAASVTTVIAPPGTAGGPCSGALS
jgi:hypothetical protein